MQIKLSGSLIKFKKEYFVFLLPAFFIIHRLSEHYESILLSDALILLLRYLLIIIIISLVSFLYFKSLRKSFLFTTGLMAFHFFYGSLHDWLKEFLNVLFFTKYIFIIPFSILLFIFFISFLKRSKSNFSKLVLYLNLTLIILIAFDGFKYVLARNKTYKSNLDLVDCKDCPKPDVYLIISDGYAGEMQLKDVFKFDNSVFYNDLKARGFFVVDSSFSNYKFTANSITSMLNMNYLKNFREDRTHEKIAENETVNYLKSIGYEIKNLSLFKIEDQYPFSETHYFPVGTDLITDHTFLSRINRDIGFHLITKFNLNQIVKKLQLKEKRENIKNLEREKRVINKTLNEASIKNKKPKFVYAHLIMPHGPYNFDKEGKPLDNKLPENIKYIEYLQYTNKQILKLIDGISKNETNLPIIIFMSDHGHRTEEVSLPEKYYFSNINAVYYPNKNYNLLYKGMSNVNQFRVLFNSNFNQKLPLLKDSIP